MTVYPLLAVPEVVKQRTWPAVLTLYLLAALIPESIATGNTPVVAYLHNPAILLYLVAFYGGADVAIRELRVRRGLGWRGTLLLGVAFGFANEGMIAATWYKVAPTGYTFTDGHPGVDLAWAVLLTIFHAVFSVVVPIVLVQLLYPGIADRRWVGRPGFAVAVALPVLLTLATLLAPMYRPQRVVVVVAIAILIALAVRRRVPRPRPAEAKAVPSNRRIRWAGAAATVAFFAVGYLVPGIVAHAAPGRLRPFQLLYIVGLLGVFAAGLRVARRWSRRPGWGPPQVLAGITGLLLPSVLLTTVNPAVFLGGALVLSVPFVVLLWRLARRLRPDAVAA